jgi:pimeloyl-ACP methyl ester carboxylesterase
MPFATVRGVQINYKIVGGDGPWVAINPGGRREYKEVEDLAERIAAKGYRVMLHDRRNVGASDISLSSEETEEAVWADDLHELLAQHDALPAFVGGSSSGARMSMLFGLRHPTSTRGLLLMRVTGGAFAAGRLPENYYDQFIRAAKAGGMAAVCETEAYGDRIKANPKHRDTLMAIDPAEFIETLQKLRALFVAGANLNVMGMTDAELDSITAPTIVIPGNDNTHASEPAGNAHRLIPGAELHNLPLEFQDVDVVSFDDWEPYYSEIAETFDGFMQKTVAAE